MEHDRKFLAQASQSAKDLSRTVNSAPNRIRKKMLGGMRYLLNSSLLVDISGIMWEVKDGQLCPIFLPPFFDTEENVIPERQQAPIAPRREEELSDDDPRASVYVQGRFDVSGNGDVNTSYKRVPISVSNHPEILNK